MLPWAYPSSYLKWHLGRLRRSLYFTIGSPPLPLKIAFMHGGSRPPSNACFFGLSPLHIPNGISISSAVFAQLTTESCYTLQWAACLPLWKLSLPMWISGSHLTHDSLAPPEFLTQTASRSVQLFLQGSLLWQTDRQTDRQTMLLGLWW